MISPANICFFKVYNRNTVKWCEICSKFTIKIPEQCHDVIPSFLIVHFEYISHIFLVFLELTLNRHLSGGSEIGK